MPRCPSCHAEHRPEARFCQACGEPLAALAVNGSAPRLLRHRGRASSPNGPIVAANGAVEGTADVLVPDDPDLSGRGWVRPDRAPAESRPAATDAVRHDAEPSVWQDADEEPVGWPSVGTADAITGTVRGF